MKIRIRGNTLRLRLSQTEVDQLKTNGQVEESIHFGPDPEDYLAYVLVLEEGHTMTTRYSHRLIKITVPPTMATQWADNPETVSMQAQLDLGAKGHLDLLVEKDFQCLKERIGEDESDNFPNPNISDQNC